MYPFSESIQEIESYYQKVIPDFTHLRYYQYLALLYTFIFASLQHNEGFKRKYIDFISTEVLTGEKDLDFSRFLSASFNRLWYRMATASGKTILMYAISYMYIKHFASDIKTLYILVPSDELRTQHSNFLRLMETGSLWWSGRNDTDALIQIDSFPFFWDMNLSVKLTTLSKMHKDAGGVGFSDNAIMIFDEAHKGASSSAEDSSTEQLKNTFIEKSNTLLLEFSATFQKAFEADLKKLKNLKTSEKNIFDWYIFSGVMKYNLYDFNRDGFGKSYYVDNLQESQDPTHSDKRTLVCKSLVNFWLQLAGYHKFKQEYVIKREIYKDYGSYLLGRDGTKIFQPLYMGLSRQLIDTKGNVDKDSGTSLVDIIKHLQEIFSNFSSYESLIEVTSKELSIAQISCRDLHISAQEIYFHLTGEEYSSNKWVAFQLWYDKAADEIKLLIWSKKMLINTGSNAKLAEELKNQIPDLFSVQDQFWSGGKWFTQIDTNPDILYLFWSKKFIEGWDSKRPSTIMLFKMGKQSTVIATQILWRGLRLAGRNGDGYRHIANRIRTVENIGREKDATHLLEFVGLFWYEITEFKNFIASISGDQLHIRINKQLQYTKHFLDFLQRKGVDPTNKTQLNRFLGKTFTYRYQEIDNNDAEVVEDAVLIAEVLANKEIEFKLEWTDAEGQQKEKKIWLLSHSNHNLLAQRESGVLRDGKGGVVNTSSKASVFLIGFSLLGDFGVKYFIQQLRNRYQHRNLSNELRESIAECISILKIQTDYFSQEDIEIKSFDIAFQSKVLSTFTSYVLKLFEKIDNRINSAKNKQVLTKDGRLNTDNFINQITINLLIKKDTSVEFKSICDAFQITKDHNRIEENFEDLNQSQQKVFAPFFQTKNQDCHFYERLYFIPLSGKNETECLHTFAENILIGGNEIVPDQCSPEPMDLKLNQNEDSRLTAILNEIGRNSNFFQNYDIFYLRNLVGVANGGIRFVYTDTTGNLKYFFPDFIFRFLEKNSDKKILVYFEPKSTIDANREDKKILLDKQMQTKELPWEIQSLFTKFSAADYSKAEGNKTFWWGMYLDY